MGSLLRYKIMSIKEYFLKIQWGAKSFIALYASVLSGIVVALQYSPATPFYSTSSMDLLVPFGAFFRSLHFFSSQLFFALLVFHLLAIIIEKNGRQIPAAKWIKLVSSLIVTLLLLFTGYVLRADTTGEFAGIIAENIINSIPVFGSLLNSALFSIEISGVMKVYANHLISLGVLWGILSWEHIRRFRVNWKSHPVLVVSMLIFSAFVNAPMEPEKLGVFYVTGPWFFVGLQELLRYFQPIWAGVVFPATFCFALFFCQSKKNGKYFLAYAALWLIIYTGFTIAGFVR
jgi:ubiquinol-cytochrome c reductase cytochrome b subunit